MPYVVERIVQQGFEANKGRVFIPTGALSWLKESIHNYYLSDPGFQSKELIVSAKLGLGDVDQYPEIDVTLDGADELVSVFGSGGISF